MELRMAEVSPFSSTWLPMIVITPFASAEPLTTILVGTTLQELGNTADTSAIGELLTASEMPVRQVEAAKITSETRALTV